MSQEEQTREQILEQLIRGYEALLADMQVHVPIGAGRMRRADELHAQAYALGIIEDKAVEQRKDF